MRRSVFGASATVLLFLLAGIAARAQQTTADVLGTVTDPTGGVVSAANVTIENLGTHETRSTKTNGSGDYTFTLLPVGHYSVRVQAGGFKAFTVSDLPLAAGDRARVNAQMQVGQQTQTVEVVAAPPALQTDSSTLATTVTDKQVQDLPLNGRNFINLATLVPGANNGAVGSVAGGTRPDDRRQSSAISVNGQNTLVNDEMIDGMDNNERVLGTIGVRPSIDAIAEFRVQTNLYTAEVGRTAGGIINIITKAGTNNFHGTAYDFLRNDLFDAKDFFAVTKPEYRQNQFGGSIGGPIRRNKTFFFADYEGLRIVQGVTYIMTVPTLFEETHVGNFSDVGGPTVPASLINPIGAKYFALYPTPNLPGTANNFESSPNRTQFSHTADARIDQHFNDDNILFGRYTINHVDTFTPGILPAVGNIQPSGNLGTYAGPAAEQQQNVELNYVHIFTPALLLELKAGYTRINNASYPLNYGTNLSQAFGIQGANISETASGLTPVSVTGYGALGDSPYVPLIDIDNTFQYNGSVTYNRGAHSFKIGAALIRRQFTNIQSSYPKGTFSFNGFVTGNPLADLLEGTPYTTQRGNQLAPYSYRTWEPSVYFQDDWHVAPWLTLNLGVRYDVFTPFTERHNQLVNFDQQTATLIVAGQNGSRTADVATDYRDLAPRFGFAATVAHNTVLRGGYGISFWPENYGAYSALQNQPYVYSYGPVYYGSMSTPLPTPVVSNPATPIGSISGAVAFNFRSSYMHQFNLTLQRQFGANTISLSYVGELGRHLGQYVPNVDVPPPSTATNFQVLRPYYGALPNITSISELYSEGTSSYNAMEIDFERRYTNGLSLTSNYTWSHGINDVTDLNLSNTGGYGLLPGSIATYDRASSDLDIRQRFVFMANYDLPFGKSMHGFGKRMVNGWQLNTIYAWQTGLPFTVTDSRPQINTGVGADRPNAIASPTIADPTIAAWFNVNAFAPQTFGHIGSEGRNVLNGPNLRHLDLSVFRNFALRESYQLQFRAECFNISNTPSFANPNASLATPGFGTISSTSQFATPRQIQFALKLLF